MNTGEFVQAPTFSTSLPYLNATAIDRLGHDLDGRVVYHRGKGEPALSEMPFVDFYTRVVQGFHGANVENYLGSRPRGAFTDGQPGTIRLMAVLLNPGQPHALEAGWQGNASSADLAKIMWDSSGSFLRGDYHSRTLAMMRNDVGQLLGQPFAASSQAFMFTNLVRCSTSKNHTPDAEAIGIGATWLREEIGLWRPDKVVAYGNVVALGMLSHGIRVDALLPHPAAVGKWLTAGKRRAQVAEIGMRLGLVDSTANSTP